MSGTLVLVRHGQSEWNLKNLFTGWTAPDLTEKGEADTNVTMAPWLASTKTMRVKTGVMSRRTFGVALTMCRLRAAKA